ncbi:MAG TPA: hypothetical protein VOA87_02600 [Thermoanaerobaculia bacterium]|nr:hypothetical protein [Thermoanaerobaculia bacterium]
MVRSLARVCLTLAVLALLLTPAAPVGAEVFHVTLNNGAVLDTLYQPQEASWDSGLVLVLTDVGNWIGLRKDEIAHVVSENATRGFGISIKTNTISLGFAPNDNAIPNDKAAQAPGNQQLQAIQNLQQSQAPQPNYTIQQGVQTEQTQGIPAGFISPFATPGGRPPQ